MDTAPAVTCIASTNWESPPNSNNNLESTGATNETFAGRIACTGGTCVCDNGKSCGNMDPYLVRTHSLVGLRRFEWRFEVKVEAKELENQSTFITPKGLYTVFAQWPGSNTETYQVRGSPAGSVAFWGATQIGSLSVNTLSDFTTVRINASRPKGDADWLVEDVTFQNGGPETSVKGASSIVAKASAGADESYLQIGAYLSRALNCKDGSCKYEASYTYRNVSLKVCK
jgi:hypothetical protein